MDGALLVLRVTVGLLVAGHGAQKLFSWFGGQGLGAMSGWLATLGYRPSRLWAWLSGLGEFVGGGLFALGLFNPLGSSGIAAVMLTAIARAHWPKVWASQNGFELPLTYLVVAVTVGLTGPGAYSLDAVWGTAVPMGIAVVVAVAALAAWIIGLAISTSRPAQQKQDA